MNWASRSSTARPMQTELEKKKKLMANILSIAKLRSTFGRIAAQTAKQVINQRVRSAERELVFSEYRNRKAELVTGIARRFERGDIVVDLGKAEAISAPPRAVSERVL